MKKLIFLSLVLFGTVCFAQPRFVVQNGTSRIFSNINDAVTAANSGDTLYIPGGGFTIGNTSIAKTLHWVGVGHYPDSTSATGQTRILSYLTFSGNCDSSSFEGIYFPYDLTFGSGNNDALNISIKKCRIGGTLTMRAYETDSAAINFHITESVLTNLNARYGSNCLIEKSIINRVVQKFIQSYFNFNDFNTYESGARIIQRSFGCLFSNNIFSYHYGLYYSESCEFNNNLFCGPLPYDPVTSTYTGSNNIINIERTTVYNSVSGIIYDFNYEHNYHLQTGCPAIGAADDGTEMGIYGTANPYKEGAVPFYPHIQMVNINKAAANGELGVKITVAGQER